MSSTTISPTVAPWNNNTAAPILMSINATSNSGGNDASDSSANTSDMTVILFGLMLFAIGFFLVWIYIKAANAISTSRGVVAAILLGAIPPPPLPPPRSSMSTSNNTVSATQLKAQRQERIQQIQKLLVIKTWDGDENDNEDNEDEDDKAENGHSNNSKSTMKHSRPDGDRSRWKRIRVLHKVDLETGMNMNEIPDDQISPTSPPQSPRVETTTTTPTTVIDGIGVTRCTGSYHGSIASVSSIHQADGCAICWSGFRRGQIVCHSNNASCVHVFHQHCMTPWLTENEECPVCRQIYLIVPPTAAATAVQTTSSRTGASL